MGASPCVRDPGRTGYYHRWLSDWQDSSNQIGRCRYIRSIDVPCGVHHTASAAGRQCGPGWERHYLSMSKWIEFNIHDYAHVRVDRDAPTAPLLSDMFGPFQATGLPHHDLTITGEMQELVRASDGETEYRYTD